ncbi:hypothetical protein BJ165DRAFT_1499144 [Panaeolus papilionaceus]|nr:hypothetical protein BJ165DRAFT_1499144 [Panaeolus papilionaceus]
MTDECLLCSKTLKNPVSIPCGHLFCLKCLNDYARPKRTAVRECPSCEGKFYNISPSDLKKIRAELREKGLPKEIRVLFNDHVRKIQYNFNDARKRTDEEMEKLETALIHVGATRKKYAEAEAQAKTHSERLLKELGQAENRTKALTDANYDLDWELKGQAQRHIQVTKNLKSKLSERENALAASLARACADVNRLTTDLKEEKSQHDQQDHDYYDTIEALREENASIIEEYSSRLQDMEQKHALALRDLKDAQKDLVYFRQCIEDEQIEADVARMNARRAIDDSLSKVMLYGCLV